MPVLIFDKRRKNISTTFTAAACLNSRIFLRARFFVRPSDSDSGQDLSDSGEEDKAPEIEFSEYELPALLSDSDDEDDVIHSQGTNVTDLPLASNDDALRSSSENDNDVVENYDGTGSGGGTDETDKDWSPARQSRKMQPKKRRKYAAREKKPFCELMKKTIQNRTSELR